MRNALLGALIAAPLLFIAAPAQADDARCIDASERSIALRRSGKLLDATKELVACADLACPREVSEECTRRARLVDASIPTLILGATDANGRDRVDVRVTVDGAVVAQQLDGRPLALDPGPHVVKLESPSKTLEKTFVLRESEKGRREIFDLAPPVIAPPPPPPPAPWFNTQRKLSVAAGGLAIVGVAFGVTFGVIASGKKSTEKDDCSASACPDHAGATKAFHGAQDAATVSTISWIAAGAFLTTAAVLFFTAAGGASASSASASSAASAGGAQPLAIRF